jgi:hypothetical protein
MTALPGLETLFVRLYLDRPVRTLLGGENLPAAFVFVSGNRLLRISATFLTRALQVTGISFPIPQAAS